jgi:hypothetical protein
MVYFAAQAYHSRSQKKLSGNSQAADKQEPKT